MVVVVVVGEVALGILSGVALVLLLEVVACINVAIEMDDKEEGDVIEIDDTEVNEVFEDVTGRVVIMKAPNYPDESEHPFVFAWVKSIHGHRLQVIEYSQSTDLCGELVVSEGPEDVDRERIFSDSFTYRLTSRQSRRCSGITTNPTYTKPPRRLYISRQTYNHISTIVEGI